MRISNSCITCNKNCTSITQYSILSSVNYQIKLSFKKRIAPCRVPNLILKKSMRNDLVLAKTTFNSYVTWIIDIRAFKILKISLLLKFLFKTNYAINIWISLVIRLVYIDDENNDEVNEMIFDNSRSLRLAETFCEKANTKK